MSLWHRFFTHRAAGLSFIFLLFITVLALAATWISPYSFEEQNIALRLQTPSFQHWAGTDSLGRDLFSRILFGAQMSLAVGYITTLVGLFVGLLAGVLAGYAGGWVDSLIMRISEILYSFPSILTAILVMMVFDKSIFGLFFALSVTSWVVHARVVRAQTLQIKESLYVDSSRAMGASHLRIIFKHIIPNLSGPLAVSLSVQIPNNIMAESFLSFIGLGLQPPYSSWGTLANEGFRAMMSYPHLMIYPGIVLFITMLAFNFFGDGIRDLLDPRQSLDFR